MDYEDLGKRLSKELKKYFAGKELEIITKIIPFTNNDVPEFLKKLEEFENREPSNIIVKSKVNNLEYQTI